MRGSPESATLWLFLGKATTPRPAQAMTQLSDTLPDDIDALRALILAERAAHADIVAERDTLAARNARLEAIIQEIRRAHFGRKSERITDDQLALALEELETSLAKAEAEDEKADPALKTERTRKRRASRGESLDHLPHEEVVIEPDSTVCPCCGGDLHVIGEDSSKRLDKVPAKVRVIVTRRPKYACRACERTGADDVAGVIQAPAPARLIEGGLPTEALVADVVVAKHADHLPLYRQSQILARYGVRIERSTLAQWVGAAAAELQPLHDHLLGVLKASPKLFCDETRCPVLDPGAGKTKTGFMWAIARDDRPWGGEDPPAVAYAYAPGRGGEHAARLLEGFTGILQVDGYAAYKKLAAPARPGGPVTLAYCWSHLRRQFYEVYVGGNAPIATEALARIKLLYDIEAEIRGLPPGVRRAIRQERSKPVIEALKPWFEASLAKVPKGGKLADALSYARIGDHAAVADQHHAVEVEALFQLLDLRGKRFRIAGIALEHLDRHGATVSRAQQAVDDLHLALFAVAIVAEAGEIAAAPLDIAGRDVVEHEAAALKMLASQLFLHISLADEQPVEHFVKL
jgi:transposase